MNLGKINYTTSLSDKLNSLCKGFFLFNPDFINHSVWVVGKTMKDGVEGNKRKNIR